MSDVVQQETWQVEVGGQIYEADFAELAAWVAEGALQPDDNVRRGNLRWIVAKKVPALIPHFNARRDGTAPPPVVLTVTDAAKRPSASEPVVDSVNAIAEPAASTQVIELAAPSVPRSSAADENYCCRHTNLAAYYLCEACNVSYCKECPNSYGGSVKICPACGGLCKPRSEAVSTKEKQRTFETAVGQGFGLTDLAAAFAYPFKFKVSLFFGCLMFMFFSLGQAATALGGIFMIAAALFCYMLANMLTFGVLANVADSFSQGKIGVNFMPDFDEFSLWDDVIHPFFLSIAAYISSFGLFFVMIVIGGYMVMSSVAAEQKAMMSEIEKLPGTHYYDTQKTVQQSDQVNKLVGDLRKQNEERLTQQAETTNGDAAPATSAGDTEDSVMKANDLINKARKDQLESALGKAPETRTQEQEAMIKRFLTLAAPLVVLAGIGLLWGLFYFPAACTVAGYSRSFLSTINPLVGLDTIKRLGFDYIKLLFMCLIVAVCSIVVGFLVSAVFSAFEMPGYVNLPARAVGSLFSFYFWIVFSCLIGFVLFKASQRLKLYK